MGMKSWSNSRSQSIQLSRTRSQRGIQLGLGDDDCDSKWKALWRKLKREKHKLFFLHPNTSSSSSSSSSPGQYDPDTYSRNFDEGLGCAEPENFSRSFSARYADPSRIRDRR